MPFADALTLAEFTGDDSLNSARGTLLLEQASAIIRNHCRQTFDLVTNDEAELRGTTSQRLLLPERPVVDVTSVVVDGASAGSWRRVRDSLWRSGGWGGPSTLVTVTYTHGFAAGSPAMGTLEAVCLQVAARGAANPQSLRTFAAAGGTSLTFHDAGAVGLTAAEQAVLDRFKHEMAAG